VLPGLGKRPLTSDLSRMRTEILQIEKIEDLNFCAVLIRVPDFENFGVRMDEIKEKESEAELNDPKFPDFLKETTEKLDELTKSNLKTLEERPTTLPAGPEKDWAHLALEIIKGMEKEFWSDHDPRVLTVNFPNGVDWDNYEAKLNKFLTEWPELRPKFLEEIFALYKQLHPRAVEFYREDCREFTLPDPTSAKVVENLFKIHSIHLHVDDRVGISGNCTWDHEHGFGAMIENGRFLEIGAADEAF
jgi:hypothetical protein